MKTVGTLYHWGDIFENVDARATRGGVICFEWLIPQSTVTKSAGACGDGKVAHTRRGAERLYRL